ncbi:hypothetical protein PQX77_003779 [Marasmius sp. AFHP31]|nr:hypothetical protein PQX77_003779 [Marasmius sp. AFHP31]
MKLVTFAAFAATLTAVVRAELSIASPFGVDRCHPNNIWWVGGTREFLSFSHAEYSPFDRPPSYHDQTMHLDSTFPDGFPIGIWPNIQNTQIDVDVDLPEETKVVFTIKDKTGASSHTLPVPVLHNPTGC